MFQSLFYWKLLWKLFPVATPTMSSIRFNPYSIVRSSGICVPLLRVLSPPHGSILILLEVTLEERCVKKQNVRWFWFQSLFYWKLLWKTQAYLTDKGVSKVSILILLEVTLEALYRKRSLFLAFGFNPYSIGSYFGSFNYPTFYI